jgi:transposase
VEFPRFRGHLSAWSVRTGQKDGVHVQTEAVPQGVPAAVPEAVELVRASGRPIKQLARELDVSYESLRLWVKQAEIDAGEREGLSSGEREELRQLRRENRVLRQEREILKKAAAFFARESEPR